MKSRLLAVVLAALLAVAGAAAVLAYVHQADNRAIAGLQPRKAYVAVRTIPAGTPLSTALDGGMMSLQALPARTVPSDALTTTAGHAGQVFGATVPAGQELLVPMLRAKTAAGAPARPSPSRGPIRR